MLNISVAKQFRLGLICIIYCVAIEPRFADISMLERARYTKDEIDLSQNQRARVTKIFRCTTSESKDHRGGDHEIGGSGEISNCK